MRALLSVALAGLVFVLGTASASAEGRCKFNLTGAKPQGTYVGVWKTKNVSCPKAVAAVENGNPRLRLIENGGSLKINGWRCRLTQFSGGIDWSWTFRCRDGRRSFIASGRP